MSSRLARPIALLGLVAPAPAFALDLYVVGAWSVVLDAGDLVGGAGTDLPAATPSASAEVSIDVASAVDASDTWRVEVRRGDTTWDADVRVWVQRTSAGSGSGSIDGGTTWVEVTSTDGTFFTGAGDRSDVGVQIRVTGLSVEAVPPDTYATTLTYTVVDT